MATSSINDYVGDYANVRSLPALLSLAFALTSLYAFGGVSQVSFPWVDYTLQGSHTLLISLGAYALAFASSETKRFEHYETWEQGAIAAGPAVLIGFEYFPAVVDAFNTLGDPLGSQIAFILTVVSWGVAIR